MTDTAAHKARETRERAMLLAQKHNPLPYIRGSRTSKAAARDAEAKAPSKRVQVLALLLHRGEAGCTDHQIAETLEMPPSTARPRRVELVEMGLVVDSGKRRETPYGSEATVWVADIHSEDQVGMDL